jgi:hypothetical protein
MNPTKISGGDTSALNNPQINRIENPAIKIKKRKSDTKQSVVPSTAMQPEIQPVAQSDNAPNIFSWFGTGIANVASNVGTGISTVASNVGTGIANTTTNVAGVFSSKPIEKGTKIFGKFYNTSGKFTGTWYPAVITGMNEDGTYEITYNDDGSSATLPKYDIRVVHPGITIDKETNFNKLYNYSLEVDNQKKKSGLGVANKPTEQNCANAASTTGLENKSCDDYKTQMNDPEFQQYFKRERIYNIYTSGLNTGDLDAKLYGGKSRKQRKSHKNNKSRKNRKSRKQRK